LAKKAPSQKDWLEVALNWGLFDSAGDASAPYFTATEGMGDAIVLRGEIRQTVGFIRGLYGTTPALSELARSGI
jgi:hypothetical protein